MVLILVVEFFDLGRLIVQAAHLIQLRRENRQTEPPMKVQVSNAGIILVVKLNTQIAGAEGVNLRVLNRFIATHLQLQSDPAHGRNRRSDLIGALTQNTLDLRSGCALELEEGEDGGNELVSVRHFQITEPLNWVLIFDCPDWLHELRNRLANSFLRRPRVLCSKRAW